MHVKRALPIGLALALLAPAAAAACPQHTPSEEMVVREQALAELLGGPGAGTPPVGGLPTAGAPSAGGLALGVVLLD